MHLVGASPFTESIILATICGRTLSHRQQSVVEQVYSHVSQHFWERHDWLHTILQTRCDSLMVQYPSAMLHTDCLLLFTKMMAQTTVLYLCRVIESMPWGKDEYRNAIVDFRQKSLLAAKEIVNLTRSLPHLSNFKVDTTLSSSLLSLPSIPTTLFSFVLLHSLSPLPALLPSRTSRPKKS